MTVTLINESSNRWTGRRTRHWDAVRNGVNLGLVSKGDEPFAKWRFRSVDGDTRSEFASHAAVLSFLETFQTQKLAA